MKVQGIVIAVYGFTVLTTVIIGYFTPGNLSLPMAVRAFDPAGSGLAVLRFKKRGFVFAPVSAVLVMLFFGYRSTTIGELVPSGLVAHLSHGMLIQYFLPRGKKDL